MANRDLVFSLKINGVEQSISTLNQLETTVEELREELQRTEIGSERFNQLQREIREADSAIREFDRQVEGIDAEQQVAQFAALGQTVVGGFALATEAISLFNSEGESAEEQAERIAEAQQKLAIVLEVVAIAQGIAETRTLITTLALRAQQAAVVSSIPAFSALFAVIAANPIGALITAIGLLVTAFYALSDSTDDSTEALKRNERQQKLNELQSKRLSREIEDLNKSTDALIDSYDDFDLDEATQELAKLEEQLLSLQQTQDLVSEGFDAGAIGNAIINGTANLQDFNLTLAEQEELLNTLFDAQEKYEGIVRLGTDAQVEQAEQTLELIGTLEDELNANIERGQAENEALQDRIDALKERIKDLNDEVKEQSKKAFDNFADSIGDVSKELEKLGRGFKDLGDVDLPPAIAKLVEARDALEEIRKEAEKEGEAPGKFILDVVDNITEGLSQGDEFGRLIENTRDKLSAGFQSVFAENELQRRKISSDLNIPFRELPKTAEEYFTQITELTQSTDFQSFSQEQQRVFLELTQGYKTLTKQAQEVTGEFGKETLKIDEFLTVVGDKLKLEGSVNFAEVTEKNFRDLEKSLGRELQIGEIVEIPIAPELQFAEERFDEYIDKIEETITSQRLREAVDELGRDLTIEEEDIITQKAQEEAQSIISTLTETTTAITTQEDKIRGFFGQVQQAQTQSFAEVAAFLGIEERELDTYLRKVSDKLELITPESEDYEQFVSLAELQGVTVEEYIDRINQERKLFNEEVDRLIEEGPSALEVPPLTGPIIPQEYLDGLDDAEEKTEGLRLSTISLATGADTPFAKFLERQEKLGLSLDGLDDRLKNLAKNPVVRGGLITKQVLNNIDDFIEKTGLGLEDLANGTEQGLRRTQDALVLYFGTSLEELGITAEQIQNIFDKVYNNIEKGAKDTTEEVTFTLQDGLALLFDTIANIGDLIQQQFSLRLEKLEVEFEETQAQIVGDSKRSEELREENTKIYEERRKEIEKESRISSLRFARAQAIANTAQAVINALATIPPPFGQIAAGVAAGIGVAQQTIIQEQISFVKNMRQGGKIEMRSGGLARGRTHEQGGIPIGNTGIFIEGQEAVINRQATLKNQELLSTINMSEGGVPMVNNVFDDSRIVEVLSKQNNKPIRAYVVEKDISRSQGVQRRLEQLSKL